MATKKQPEGERPKLTRQGTRGGKLLNTYKGMACSNPKGRPRGSMNTKTIIRKYLEALQKQKNPMNDNKIESLPAIDHIVIKQVAKAMRGDTGSFNALLDRVDGRPKVIQELTGKDGKPLQPETTHTVIFENYTEEKK